MMECMHWLYIGLFGLAGIYARYIVNLASHALYPGGVWGTLAVNIAGSFAAGLIYTFAVERGALSADLRTGILVGFLGGFTTFSAFSLEAARLSEADTWTAVLYLVVSPAAGFAAAKGALELARHT